MNIDVAVFFFVIYLHELAHNIKRYRQPYYTIFTKVNWMTRTELKAKNKVDVN
jgi:hypothetical protein